METIYTTICTGCNMGCGLYLRNNNDHGLTVDFRKNSPVNAGKLCRFGMNITQYYTPLPTTTIQGKPASLDDAISETAKAITASKGKIAFLSAGNTTSEEHLALTKLAEALGTTVNTTMGAYSNLPHETHPTLGVGIPFTDIENAEHILLFTDPTTQYPLLVRNLLKAKKKGAKITAAGYKKLSLADENLPASADYEEQVALNEKSVIISDLHPHSNPSEVAGQLNLAKKTGAKILFLKPFVNATGANLVSKHTEQKPLQQLLKDIDSGKITALYCLDTDPLEIMLNTDEVKETLGKLDALIIQTGRESTINKLATITLATPPFYQKQGTIINAEGRIIENKGDDVTGIDILNKLISATGGSETNYEKLHSEILKTLNITRVDEHTIPAYDKPDYPEIPTNKPEPIDEKTIITIFTPFTWTAIQDDDFVELNINDAKEFKLRKGNMVNLTTGKGSLNKKFKISQTHDNIILTCEKLPIVEDLITTTEAMRV